MYGCDIWSGGGGGGGGGGPLLRVDHPPRDRPNFPGHYCACAVSLSTIGQVSFCNAVSTITENLLLEYKRHGIVLSLLPFPPTHSCA